MISTAVVLCVLEARFTKSMDLREKSSSVLVGGHEPEGPETKRFKSLTTETDDGLARRLFPSGRRISTPMAHAAHLFGVRLGDRLGHHSETISDPVWETVWRPPVNRMAPKTWIFRGSGDPVLVLFEALSEAA